MSFFSGIYKQFLIILLLIIWTCFFIFILSFHLNVLEDVFFHLLNIASKIARIIPQIIQTKIFIFVLFILVFQLVLFFKKIIILFLFVPQVSKTKYSMLSQVILFPMIFL